MGVPAGGSGANGGGGRNPSQSSPSYRLQVLIHVSGFDSNLIQVTGLIQFNLTQNMSALV